MGRKLSEAKTFLILDLRHLGDAVVVAGMVNALSVNRPDIEIDILGREDLRGLTEQLCRVRDYISVEIPFFGHHKKSAGSIAGATRKILALRNRRYDVCINLTGDVRENLIGWMTGARITAAPAWPAEHPFRKHIRSFTLPGLLTYPVPIADSARGYYESMQDLARQLGGARLCWPGWPGRHAGQEADAQTIAVHPGASHEAKRWSTEKWKQLIHVLRAEGFRIRIYGSPSEDVVLRSDYSAELADGGVEVMTGSIPEFLASLSDAALLVGMDSFSVHAAHALGIPAVMLHGPYDPSVMTPPSGVPISAGALCPIFPCYKPNACRNSASRYVCVRGIQVADIAAAVRAIRERLDAGTHV